MKNIVILGGSYAGICAAHLLLREAAKTKGFKVTLVTPNTHFYWNIASPRGTIPGQYTDEQLFQPIAPAFKKYPAGTFEFILASAESLNVSAKQVRISGSSGGRTIDYDYLVLATGSRTKGDTPFKNLETTEATKEALHDFQARVKRATTVVVAGGGPTGCEIAGELAYEYGNKKEVILVVSGATVLDDAPESVTKIAMKELKKLNVSVKVQAKVKESVPSPNGRQEVTLSTGQKITTDMFIPTYGLAHNTSYVEERLLNANGSVPVDLNLQVKGAGPVWAIGDVNDIETQQYLPANSQAAHAAKNILLVLKNKAQVAYKPQSSAGKGVQIGKKTGVGHFGTWRIPSFMVVYLRKQLFLERFGTTMDGSLF